MVEALHDKLIAEFGGIAGFNDKSLFLTALSRSLSRWQYGQQDDAPPDVFNLAAAYGYGLVKNHAFRDGNEHTGAAACLLFLRADGREIVARPA